MEITTEMVKTLREQCGAGIMDCRNALKSTGGDMEKAQEMLKEKGLLKAQKKAARATGSGLVECYVHTAGRIAAMVEINCETDFVARTDEFKDLAHNIAMQVAAMAPVCVSNENMPEGSKPVSDEECLMLQPYIKDPTKMIKDVITETIAKTGENIKVRRFTRYELGN